MKKAFYILTILATVFIVPATAKKLATGYHHYNKNVRFEENPKIKLILDGKTYEVQNYNLAFYAPIPDKPSTTTLYQTNSINISIRSSKIDQDLLNWILAPDPAPKNGQIIIYDADTNKTIRTITLTGLKTGNYNENNNSNFPNNNQYTILSLHYQSVGIKL
jgi:Hemolysin coregulated protein Hcp (TssD)